VYECDYCRSGESLNQLKLSGPNANNIDGRKKIFCGGNGERKSMRKE